MPAPQRVTNNYEGEVDLKKTKGKYEPKFREREREEGGLSGGGGVGCLDVFFSRTTRTSGF